MNSVRRVTFWFALSMALMIASVGSAAPLDTAFTYQGQLKQGGVPANDGAAALSAEKDGRIARVTERLEHVVTLLARMVQERKGSK